ncbi:hypothetical protein KQ51_00992 [Candidatus Izimaplasma bacterium HR1]|uniref:hypothetical protein n=1 Tax=Candidatus Izimoplasma sp. HR1 TaxID=1541959 RepID=UPI0004F6C94F|nr:hypothetical protein KQ51_00992 [Candidatus Izimaplasma bacterium HR1]
MKKLLSLLLVLMLSLTVVGVSQEASAVAYDAVIYVHVYQHDGDYTNTGTGLWDGVNWNEWGDTADTTDSLGGVITIGYTTAELAALSDSLEFKPVSNTTDPDNTLLAPANEGKVMLDITDLKAETITELHAYYVEGADGFFIKEHEENALLLFVYANPAVAANADIYDGWGFHTWDQGALGTPRADYWVFPELAIDVALDAGEFDGVPMRLGGIEVGFDAQNTIGFIMHYGIDSGEELKSCSSDIKPDVSDIKAADAESDGGAKVMYYVHGACDFEADYASFLTSVEDGYRAGLKNKFVAGTEISGTSTISVDFFGLKQPWELIPSNFMVKDANGAMLRIQEIIIPEALNVGLYESDVEPMVETVVVVYVDTALDIADLGIAGDFQGWSPDVAVTSTTTDANGYYVFELSTFETEVNFVILEENGEDDVETTEVDESTVLGWNDTKISHPDNNINVDTSGGGIVEVYFNDISNDYHIKNTPKTIDPTMYTYTADETCVNNLFTIFIDTDLAHTQLGLVGTLNGWDIENTIAPVGETTEGVPYWEVCTEDVDGEFKVLFDTSDDGFAWSNPDDVEVTPNNMAIELAEEATEAAVALYPMIDETLVHEAVLVPTSIYRLSVYILGYEEDYHNLGLTGDFNGWQETTPKFVSYSDGFGNYIFDIEMTSNSGGFKLFIDTDMDGFTWSDSITEDNFNYDLAGDTSKVLVIDLTDSNAMTDFGPSVEEYQAKYSSFDIVMEDRFMYGEAYTIEYIDIPAIEDNPATTEVDETADAEIITWDLEFATVVNIEQPNVVEGMGTYAVSPTEIQVEFTDPAMVFGINVELSLFGPDDTFMFVSGSDYGLTYGAGDYTQTVTCAEGENVVFIHMNIMNTEVATLPQLGIVGSIQVAADWDIDNTIAPIGMDSEGNYVWEICLPATDEEVAFKVLYDISADGFAWSNDDDAELVTDNVNITVENMGHYYLEEGTSAIDTSKYHTIMLDTELNKDNEYYLLFNDVSGIDIMMPVLMDTEAPTVTATIDPTAVFTVNNTVTDFDVNDYFTILGFVDNREGELDFTVKTPLDMSTAGTASIVIAATDMWGNEGTYAIEFTIVDDTNPELVVDAAKEYEAGTTAPDWATFATSSDGTITVDAAEVDMAAAGVYYVNYTAADPSGNQTLKTLQVTITAAPDTGCFGSFGLGSSIGLIVAAIAGGAVLFFVRKQK